ncbi:MAG: DUF4139 domain-containing protein [Acidobacteriota bacterium]
MTLSLLVWLWAAAGPAVGTAAPDPAARAALSPPAKVSLTVYASNLALVQEQRHVDLPAGTAVLHLDGVPAGLVPASLQVTFHTRPASSVRLLEQRLHHDLISPARILEKYVGRQLTLVSDAPDGGPPRRQAATLLATRGGLVLDVGHEVLLNPPGRIIVPDLPEGLVHHPTLDWVVRARRGGPADVDLRYLTTGITWSADHVGVLSQDEKRLRLSTWVTVNNTTGVAFRKAGLHLIAGDPARLAPRKLPVRVPEALQATGRAAEMSEAGFQDRPIFDYHDYRLQRPVDLDGQGAVQLAFLENAPAVRVVKRYIITGSGAAVPVGRRPLSAARRPVQIRLEFVNSKDAGIGHPLPAGTFRVYQEADRGETVLLGENRIDHTPQDETVSLTVGNSSDLIAERVQTDYVDHSVRSHRSYEAAFRITVRNHKTTMARVEVHESIPGDWTLLASSHPSTRRSASSLWFNLDVPAGGESVLTYRVRVN